MKINPVFIFSNSQIQPPKKVSGSFKHSTPISGVKPNFENLQANFNVQFRGIGILDKITPPTFEDETLNSIIQRNTEIATIDTKNAGSRSEDNAILTAWFDDIGLEEMRAGKAYPEMMEHLENGLYDGVSFKERDELFMIAAQRLVDCGAIDDKTFVLIDTGHSIPIAAQLMKEENRAVLGDVKGTFLIDSTFPKIHPNVDAGDKEAIEIHEDIRNGAHQRISSQALDFGDIINNSYKNSKGAQGALFIGIDMHRCAKFDTSKLPTAEELKKLGLNKVAIIQELPPISIFSQSDADKIHPLTVPNVQRAMSSMQQACTEAKKTPAGTEISTASKAKIKELLTKASNALGPRDIDKIYSQLSKPDKKQISRQIEKREFGYGTKTGCGSDINEYLNKLKKSSGGDIKIFIEGAALLKLRNEQMDSLRRTKNEILARRHNSFEHTINGDFGKAFGL